MKVEAVVPAQPMQAAIAALRNDPARRRMYVDSRTVEVAGEVDVDVLRQVWLELYRDTDALRSHVVQHDGRFLVVVEGDAPPPVHDAVDARSRTSAAARGIHRSLAAQHAARVAAGDRVALAHVRACDHSLLTLTWRHEVLDGTGVASVLGDLRIRLRGQPWRPHGSLVAATRAVLLQPRLEISHELGDPPGQLHNFGQQKSGSIVTARFTIDGPVVARAAAVHATTHAVVLTAALAAALAEVGGSDGFMLSVEDCRPAAFAEVAGAFGGLSAVWLPVAAGTWGEAVRRLHQARASVQGRRPVPLTELIEPLWEAGATGAPDVVVTIHPSRDSTEAGDGWRTIDAAEQTEFAMSVDVLLSEDEIVLHVHRDSVRAGAAIVSRLADRVRELVASEPSHAIGSAGPAHASGELVDDDARLELVVAVCQNFLESPALGPETDVTAQGLTSLELMRLAVALADAGISISVSHLMAARTPLAICELAGAVSAARPRGPAASTSGLERSRLERSLRADAVPDDMHEQSSITVDEVLDPDLFERAFGYVAAMVGVLDTAWDAQSPRERPSLRAPGRVEPLAVLDCTSTPEAQERSRSWLRSDLRRGFRPGDVLYRCALARTASQTTILASWHAAVLDGWSTATLFRLLRDTYVALSAGLAAPEVAGAHINAYRALSAQLPAADKIWSAQLADARWYVPPISSSAERVTSSCRRIGPLAQLHTEGSGSPVAVALARVAGATRRALDLPSDEPLGIRTTLRSVQLAGSYDMIGQVTVDVPVRFDTGTGADAEAIVRDGLVRAWSHGHGGESAIRAAAGCPDGAELFRALLVAEDEIPDDEWVVRHAGRHTPWREVCSWRRDVSPAAWTVYLRTADGDLSVEVSTAEGDAEAVCRRIADDVAQQQEATRR